MTQFEKREVVEVLSGLMQSRNELRSELNTTPSYMIGREAYFSKNFPKAYIDIEEYSIKQHLEHLLFKERLWAWLEQRVETPTCKTCGLPNLKFISFTLGYKPFCSKKCSAQCPSTKKKRIKTCIEKYGVTNVTKNSSVVKKRKKNHFRKYGVNTPAERKSIQKKMSNAIVAKYGVDNYFKSSVFKKTKSKTSSKIEEDTCKKLQGKKRIVEGKEFDICLNDTILIEIDGDFYHPQYCEKLTFTQLNNVTNDKKKAKIALNGQYELIRIHTSALKELEEISLENIRRHAYVPSYSIGKAQVILTKEYLKSVRTKGHRIAYRRIIVNFIHEFFNITQTDNLVFIADCFLKGKNGKFEDFTLESLQNKLEVYSK